MGPIKKVGAAETCVTLKSSQPTKTATSIYRQQNQYVAKSGVRQSQTSNACTFLSFYLPSTGEVRLHNRKSLALGL